MRRGRAVSMGGGTRMVGRGIRAGALVAALWPATPATAQGGGQESLDEALCRLIEGSARAQGLPVRFLTRLIWRESSFRLGVTSSAGAQGVAQFMPGTAAERGLLDPFDPEQAIPAAARLLDDLEGRFGNLGLAAAAYNGGPGRVQAWLAGRSGLPEETRAYVAAITGRTAEEWAAARGEGERIELEEAACLVVTASLRRPGRDGAAADVALAPIAPWGVQLAGNFSKERALAAYGRASGSLAGIIGTARPMVIGTRLRSRGTRAFYRVRVPSPTREAAETLCGRIRRAGGACVVLPS